MADFRTTEDVRAWCEANGGREALRTALQGLAFSPRNRQIAGVYLRELDDETARIAAAVQAMHEASLRERAIAAQERQGKATWWLVGATVVLVLVTIVSIYWQPRPAVHRSLSPSPAVAPGAGTTFSPGTPARRGAP